MKQNDIANQRRSFEKIIQKMNHQASTNKKQNFPAPSTAGKKSLVRNSAVNDLRVKIIKPSAPNIVPDFSELDESFNKSADEDHSKKKKKSVVSRFFRKVKIIYLDFFTYRLFS